MRIHQWFEEKYKKARFILNHSNQFYDKTKIRGYVMFLVSLNNWIYLLQSQEYKFWCSLCFAMKEFQTSLIYKIYGINFVLCIVMSGLV